MSLLTKVPLIAPYATAIRVGLLASAGAGVLWFAWSWHSRGVQIEKMEEQQALITSTVAKASGVKRLTPSEVPAAVETLKANLDEARSALDRVTEATRAAKVESDRRDEELRERLRHAQQAYRAASHRIEALSSSKPAATAEEAQRRIADDSKAAWEGWKQ